MGIAENLKEIVKNTKETVMGAVQMGFDERDIRHVLKQDHLLVSGLLESLLEKSEQRDSGIEALVDSLRNELLTHAKTEGAVLYEACRRHGKDLKSFALEGYREHEVVENLLDKLALERPGSDGEFKATVTVLKELIDHHVREEEGDLFPMLAREFSENQLIQMGEEMERLKKNVVVPPVAETVAKTKAELH